MSDDEVQSTEKGDTRTVSIRAEIWHALLEIAGRQIDPETAQICSMQYAPASGRSIRRLSRSAR